MDTKTTFVLFGVAKRDRQETVCQFFSSLEGLQEFRKALPGTYDTMLLTGVSIDDFEVGIVQRPDPTEALKARMVTLGLIK